MKTAILLMAHGSRIAEANDAVYEIARMVKDMTGFDIVEVSFREQHLPNIQKGIDTCVEQGRGASCSSPISSSWGPTCRRTSPRRWRRRRSAIPAFSSPWGNTWGHTASWPRSWWTASPKG